MTNRNVLSEEKVDITPKPDIYGIFRRLPYTPNGAVAEFVDNSTASYFENKKIIAEFNNKNKKANKLVITIVYKSSKKFPQNSELEIIDNAAGMSAKNFQRAVILNIKPENTDGRNEFGMGLKTAALWFGDVLEIDSVDIRDGVKRSVKLKLSDLEQDKNPILPISVTQDKPENHGTIIKISKLANNFKNKPQKKRLVNKITTTYQKDIADNGIEIRFAEYDIDKDQWMDFQGNVFDKLDYIKPLTYKEPELFVLPADSELNKTGDDELLKHDFEEMLSFEGKDYKLKGWVGILKKGNRQKSGFTLFRRNRVIVGTDSSNLYRPSEIFGSASTFRSLRLVGQVNMDTFPVVQSKEAFDWNNGLEDEFLEKLKTITADYAKLADEIRVTVPAAEIPVKKENKSNEEFINALNKANPEQKIVINDDEKMTNDTSLNLRIEDSKNPSDFTDVDVKTIRDEKPDDFISVVVSGENKYTVQIHVNHEFFKPYSSDEEVLQFILEMSKAYALAFVNTFKLTSSDAVLKFNNTFNKYLKDIAGVNK